MKYLWRPFVPPSSFRLGLALILFGVYLAAAMIPQANGMLGSGDVAKTGRLYVGALVLGFMLASAVTDYTQRPLEIRAILVVAGMLAYALVAWPLCYWAAMTVHVIPPSSSGAYRIGMAMYNTDAGIPFVVVALRCSRLLARSQD